MHEQHKPATPYYSTPDEAFWTPGTTSAAQIEFVTTPAPADAFDAPVRRGRPFAKGQDPRRHRFTRAECVAGFWAAHESIVKRYPEAVMRDGRHIVCNFLKSRQAVSA